MPIILASVAATVVSQLFFGTTPAFIVPDLFLENLSELPYVVAIGLIAGCVAALFTYIVSYLQRFNSTPLWQRLLVAGLCTGIVAIFIPQVMGIGYDSVNEALLGETSLQILFLLCVMKLALTAINVGLELEIEFGK